MNFFLLLSFDDCSRPTAQRDEANGHAKRNEPRTNSTKYIQCLQAFLPFFRRKRAAQRKKRAKTCFEEKRSLEEFHESNVHFFSPSSFARILFRRFCRRQLSTALFSRARPLKYHFLLSPNKTISCCLPRADTRTATPSMIGAERECNLILIALLQDKNKTHERETKPGTNNENDVYFGFHLMCNWKLVEQGRMNGALCSLCSDATGTVVFLFLEMIRSIYKPRWRRKTQIIIILVLTFFAF